MAKDLTPAELAAALTALGMDIPKELAEKVSNSVLDEAIEKVSGRIETEDEDSKLAEGYTSEFFDLAARMHTDFKSEEKGVQGRGNGKISEQKIEIVTPDGKFFVRLVNDVA